MRNNAQDLADKKDADATEVAIDVGAVAQAHPEIIQDEIDNEIIVDLKVIAESLEIR